jgi:hypothetical protein
VYSHPVPGHFAAWEILRKESFFCFSGLSALPMGPGQAELVGHSLDPPERKNQQLNWMAGKPMLKDLVAALWRIVPSNKMLRAGCELMASLSLA